MSQNRVSRHIPYKGITKLFHSNTVNFRSDAYFPC